MNSLLPSITERLDNEDQPKDEIKKSKFYKKFQHIYEDDSSVIKINSNESN